MGRAYIACAFTLVAVVALGAGRATPAPVQILSPDPGALALGTGEVEECVDANGAPLPGGTLEWKPTPGRLLRLPWITAGPPGRSESLLVWPVHGTIDGVERLGLALVDMRTLRLQPLTPLLPEGTESVLDVAVSPTAAYVAHSPYAPFSPTPATITGLDLRTGEPLASFTVRDFEDAVWSAMVYVDGKVLVSGYTSDQGDRTIAYDAVTGERLWSSKIWTATSMVSDGSTVYIGVDSPADWPAIAAIDPANGRRIAAWGTSIPRADHWGSLVGFDSAQVYAWIHNRSDDYPIAVTREDGRPVTIRSRWYQQAVRHSADGRMLFALNSTGHVLLSPSGELVGTMCAKYWPLALLGPRHLVVWEARGFEPGRRLLVLALD